MPILPRAYVTLDDLDMRRLAQQDPALFLQTWPAPVTIDEIQYAPQLFSAIKLAVDRDGLNGQYWLTGSQKFQLMQGLTESLAGRVAIVDLMGLSQAEMQGRARTQQPFVPTAEWTHQARAQATPATLQVLYERIWLGSYPRLVEQGPALRDVFYRSYIQTYVQRDVQDLLKVSDPLSFHRFLGGGGGANRAIAQLRQTGPGRGHRQQNGQVLVVRAAGLGAGLSFAALAPPSQQAHGQGAKTLLSGHRPGRLPVQMGHTRGPGGREHVRGHSGDLGGG